MYLKSLLVSALLAGSALAMDFEEWNQLNKRTIVPVRRQSGSAFQPGSNSGSGATCADAFGTGFIQCGTGNECYNPDAGESCCADSYPCPSSSFCLVSGYCCPDGLDAKTCAAENGIGLSSGVSITTTQVKGTSGAATATSSSNYTVLSTGAPTTSATTAQFTGAASHNMVGSAAALVGLLAFMGIAL